MYIGYVAMAAIQEVSSIMLLERNHICQEMPAFQSA